MRRSCGVQARKSLSEDTGAGESRAVPEDAELLGRVVTWCGGGGRGGDGGCITEGLEPTPGPLFSGPQEGSEVLGDFYQSCGLHHTKRVPRPAVSASPRTR